ncbi:Ca2+/Na+ antiporter [Clostridium tetanomorphum]|uniref:Uncharacterized protein n=1 Tax=Clostridium tetanomorphum TaxID=1553 RepID=A0A923E9V3_CLOTT|nr:hypothetical protein [Clostridium tetanomorphum]KAJ51689.1 hypothetical protein CTM_11320 [Clostridium tetanomorphum DSM 665]MBC2399135.1 hypothetical protein [Clostridium tetanomorphum]NRS86130.1 Ca2+/Na+ antiporter [Clostridium tetanomorphum]NRZ95849.1 Ca2+/Na+ antiporter [Clostridium tetanomorphum]
MKDKILSIISFITIFVPITILFVWKPTNPNATAIVIGYCIFIALSFCYTFFLFAKKQLRDIYTKISLALNGLYLIGILALIVFPRLI